MRKIEGLSVSPRLAGVVIDRHDQTVAVISGGVDGAPADYARLFAAAPDLLAACEALFPADDWQRYEGIPLAERIEVQLICTRGELLALRDAISKAKSK
jgi:hypothetical protein